MKNRISRPLIIIIVFVFNGCFSNSQNKNDNASLLGCISSDGKVFSSPDRVFSLEADGSYIREFNRNNTFDQFENGEYALTVAIFFGVYISINYFQEDVTGPSNQLEIRNFLDHELAYYNEVYESQIPYKTDTLTFKGFFGRMKKSPDDDRRKYNYHLAHLSGQGFPVSVTIINEDFIGDDPRSIEPANDQKKEIMNVILSNIQLHADSINCRKGNESEM